MGLHTAILAFVCLGLTWEIHGQGGMAMADEKRLIKHLLENYDRVGKVGRPVYNANDTLTIDLDLTLVKLLKLDEERQTISLLAWYKMYWTDVLLTWAPADFGDVKAVRIPSSAIYTPDIMPFFELPSETFVKPTLAVASSEGSVIWVPMVQMTTLCPDLVPGMERVTCDIKIGSWTEDGFKLDIKEKDTYLDLATYKPNALWELVETKTTRNTVYYPCCSEPYISVTFSLTFERGLAWSSAVSGKALSLPLLFCVLLFSTLYSLMR